MALHNLSDYNKNSIFFQLFWRVFLSILSRSSKLLLRRWLLSALSAHFFSIRERGTGKSPLLSTTISREPCSEDAPHWMQIGIDVLPEYRSRGICAYLVTLLKNRIIEMGDIPFYGTASANVQSQNIALNSGFKPTWVETEAVRIDIN